jgi:transcriptional regulator with XRE-family HTH domain
MLPEHSGRIVEKHILRYRAALNCLIKKYKIRQGDLAQKVGLSQAQINRILKHPSQAGSERARRHIAAALGRSYEEMLELGRQIMDGTAPDPASPALSPGGENLSGEAADLIDKILYLDLNHRSQLRYISALVNEYYAAAREKTRREKNPRMMMKDCGNE